MSEQSNNKVTWVELVGDGYLELMPVGEQKKHYLGDECWCGVSTHFAKCGSCHTNVAIFVHLPEGKVVPKPLVELMVGQASRVIAGGHRNG